ncbi:MAG: hypothetical protein IPN86_07935 [Saprospiraceae bacterium]|nr:hypothetical protein [Saprospiraceae bacterium]
MSQCVHKITDYIPAGYTFSVGDNPRWTAVGANATYILAGPLAPATSQMISISLRIQQTTAVAKTLDELR